MIKIAFVIDTIESPTAGTEKQLLLLIKHLDRGKFQPYLCVLRSSTWLREAFNLCRLYELNFRSFGKTSVLREIYCLSRFFSTEGIDVVQTHFRDASIAGTLAARWAQVGAVVGTRRNQGYWMKGADFLIQMLLNRWVSIIVVNSESTKRWVMETEGLPYDKIEVIYNGIDLEPFRAERETSRAAVRRELGIPENAPLIGVVANLRPVKGLDVFLRAAARVKGDLPEARFVIVGEGEERPKLADLVRELALEESVTFTGRSTNIPRLMRAFDVGVLSSYSESFSSSVIEYRAASLPVVCTDVGGAREAIEDGITGYIVAPGDYKGMASRIVRVLCSMDKLFMQEATRQEAHHCFSLSAIVMQYQELYVKVVNSQRKLKRHRPYYKEVS